MNELSDAPDMEDKECQFYQGIRRVRYYKSNARLLENQRVITVGYGIPFRFEDESLNENILFSQNFYELSKRQYQQIQLQPQKFFAFIVQTLN